MKELLLPAGIAMFAVLCVGASRLSSGTRLGVALLLAVPQIYLRHVPYPLEQVWLLALGPAALLRAKRLPRGASALVLTIVLMAAVNAASAAWSVDRHDAWGDALRMLMFAGAVATAADAAVDGQVWRALRMAAPCVIAQGLLTCYFRVNSAAETAFLLASRSSVFLGSSGGPGLFLDHRNNVLDPAKAGGVFVNGNVASLFFGVCALIYFASWRHSRRKLDLVVAACAFVGIYFTGSKTGIILSILLPVIGFIVHAISDRRQVTKLLGLIVFGPVAALFAATFLSSYLNSLGGNSAYALQERQNIWSVVYSLFVHHTILGLGNGGWVAETGNLFDGLPPHNLLVAAWANAGLALLALSLVYIGRVLAVCKRAIWLTPAGRYRSVVVLLGMSATWVFIHGMGDNTSVFGDIHSAAFVAAALGLLLAAQSTAGSVAESAGSSVAGRVAVPRSGIQRTPHVEMVEYGLQLSVVGTSVDVDRAQADLLAAQRRGVLG